ncbi:MAG: ERF family protein [Clostridium baratii]
MNVYEKLMNVQKELKAPKNQYNNFGKYNYRNCEDILEALKPICVKHKAVTKISDEIIYIEGRHYVKATVTFIDVEKGDKIESYGQAREEENKKGMDVSQITGSSSSYARKYALNGMFCIDDTKDSDFTNTHDKEIKSNLSDAQIKRLYSIGNKVGKTPKAIFSTAQKDYNINDLKELTKGQYDDLCKRLENLGGEK